MELPPPRYGMSKLNVWAESGEDGATARSLMRRECGREAQLEDDGFEEFFVSALFLYRPFFDYELKNTSDNIS